MTVDRTEALTDTVDTDRLVRLAHRSSLSTLDALLAAVPGDPPRDGGHAAAARCARRLARRAEGSAKAFGTGRL